MEILSFVFGGVFRLLPELFKMIDRNKERQHEREMLDLQIKADQARADADMRKTELQGDVDMNKAELQALIEATKAQAVSFQKTGTPWLDAILVFAEALSALVRPVLSFWYCIGAYGAYKAASFYLVLSASDIKMTDAITQMWTANDHAVMLSIIGFWFVDRAIRKQAS